MKAELQNLSEQLSRHPRLRVIVLSSKEPVLLDEARQTVRALFKKTPYHLSPPQFLDKSFDWQNLSAQSTHGSLFVNQQVFDLISTFPKCTKDLGAALTQFAETLTVDHYLLLSLPAIDSATQKTKWFQALENLSFFITLWPMQPRQIEAWLENHAKQLNLSLAADQYQTILTHTTGNLVAAKQLLQRLSLRGETKVAASVLTAELKDESRFETFDLSAAFLQGDLTKQFRILKRLRLTETDPILILWVLIRDIRLLTELASLLPQQNSAAARQAIFQRSQIWDKYQQSYLKAYQRHPKQLWQAKLREALNIDKMLKGVVSGNPWHAFERLLACLPAE